MEQNNYGSFNTDLEPFEVSERDYIYILKTYAGLMFHKKQDGKFLIKPINNMWRDTLLKYKINTDVTSEVC